MMKRPILFAALACLALAGCGERHLDEVRDFVKRADAEMKPGRIPPLPEVKPYEPFEYAAFDLLDPFVPRKIEPPKFAKRHPLLPPEDRRKGPLEAFPLENLKMVGSLSQKKEFFALIKTPDNNLYRVRMGDFMGQNFGRVIDITESAVKLKELIQDSGNDWKEEERMLLLQDEQEAKK